MQAARETVKYLRRHGFYAEAKALEFVIVGAFRDPGEEEPEHIRICARCAKCKKPRASTLFTNAAITKKK